MEGFSSRLSILLCLCAVTVLTLPVGLPTSSATAADFYVIGGSGGRGGANVDTHTGGQAARPLAGPVRVGGLLLIFLMERAARAAAERSLEFQVLQGRQTVGMVLGKQPERAELVWEQEPIRERMEQTA